MKWIKEELIGSGSFGKVYKVKSEESGNCYVVKEVPAIFMSKREVTLMPTLDHPHIIRYISHSMDGSNLQLVLEYAEGGTLSKFIESCSNALSEEKIIFITSQIVLGLDYLHRKRIVHRDLKPTNILLVSDTIIKLADFGTSKNIDTSGSSSKPVGTLSYMAPEILNGGKWNTPSDIWSLGCVVYYVTERTKPFQAEAAGPLILSIVSLSAKPISEIYSTQLSNLITSMMNLSESSRPSTTDLLVHPLLACMIHSLPIRVPAILASSSLNYMLEEFINNRLLNS